MSDAGPAVEGCAGARALLALAMACVAGGAGCSVGQGTGTVTSGMLYVEGCYKGEFDLRPTFFGANPFDDTLTIRVQRGEQDILVSDGFTMLVYDVSRVRENILANGDERLEFGLPVGVSPLGFPLPDVPVQPEATFSLYLNNSCRTQNVVLSAVSGGVTFTQLFSGDPNEDNSQDRITAGWFDAVVVDPRTAVAETDAEGRPTYTYPMELTSTILGEFNFVFHRGTPAQPFP